MKYIEILNTEIPHQYVPVENKMLSNLDMHRWLDCTPGAGYSWGGHGIYFYNGKDATMFVLKWS